jgi:hypothetical protein
MNKRLQKRHDRQVSRAKARVRVSEPDVRTPDQMAAARGNSRTMANQRGAPLPYYATTSAGQSAPPAGGAVKTEAES